MVASSIELAIPDGDGKCQLGDHLPQRQTCPSTSKYAGQTGQVEYAYWTSFGQKKPMITTNPGVDQVLRVHARRPWPSIPRASRPMAPTQTTVNEMVGVDAASVTTTTTTRVTTTTAPTTTTTVRTTTTLRRSADDDHDRKGLNLKSIILVGGEGTRLRPLTYETPKQMLPLVGVPMIECVFEHARPTRHHRRRAVARLPARPFHRGVSRTASSRG